MTLRMDACDFTPEELLEHGYVASRKVDDAWHGVLPMSFGKGRVCSDLNLTGYEDCWCFESLASAIAALHTWDPRVDKEPMGSFRHPFSGRRRPDGDPALEHVLR